MKKRLIIFFAIFLISISIVQAGIISDTYGNIVSSYSEKTTQDDGSSISYINTANNQVYSLFAPDFYGFNFKSELLMSSKIGKVNDSFYKVSFNFDINNVKLISYKNDNSTSTLRINYFFNNYIRSSTSDFTKIFSSATSSNNEFDNDYFGFPFYITSCYLDCDANDGIPATSWNSKQYSSGDYWYMYINSYNGASSQWINSRFPYDNQFFDSSHMLRFSKDNFKCVYDTMNVKKIVYGCILEKNPLYRDDSYTDSQWSFNDVDSEFDITDHNAKTMIIRGSYELDLSTGAYSSGISDEESINETIVGSSSSTSKSDDYLQIQRQEELITVKKLNDKNNSWQSSLLTLIQFIFGMIVIFYYFLSLAVFFFFIFLSIPYIVRKMKESIYKLTRW